MHLTRTARIIIQGYVYRCKALHLFTQSGKLVSPRLAWIRVKSGYPALVTESRHRPTLHSPRQGSTTIHPFISSTEALATDDDPSLWVERTLYTHTHTLRFDRTRKLSVYWDNKYELTIFRGRTIAQSLSGTIRPNSGCKLKTTSYSPPVSAPARFRPIKLRYSVRARQDNNDHYTFGRCWVTHSRDRSSYVHSLDGAPIHGHADGKWCVYSINMRWPGKKTTTTTAETGREGQPPRESKWY